MEPKQKPSRAEAVEAVRTLISYIGDDPDRPGLRQTPERVVRAWESDWGQGYDDIFNGEQATSILAGVFDEPETKYNQMVIVRDIAFVSHCEHHLAAFHGTISMAYIPRDSRVLGLSKFARICDMVTRKLQVQERITVEVAALMQQATNANDVGVLVRAKHMCMCSRGVRQMDSTTITSELRGELYDNAATRAEFLRLVDYR